MRGCAAFLQAAVREKRSVYVFFCFFYLWLSELMQGRLHVSDITRLAVKKERASQRQKGVCLEPQAMLGSEMQTIPEEKKKGINPALCDGY